MAEKVPKPNAAFDINKMGDMSDFDPSNPIVPTGDTIKIARSVAPFRTGWLNGDIASGLALPGLPMASTSGAASLWTAKRN